MFFSYCSGFWASFKNFLMIGNQDEDIVFLEECKKVPAYLNASIHHFSSIFGVLIFFLFSISTPQYASATFAATLNIFNIFTLKIHYSGEKRLGGLVCSSIPSRTTFARLEIIIIMTYIL